MTQLQPPTAVESARPWRSAPTRSRSVGSDPALFAAVYRKHYQALYRYCRSILGHEEDARDALQSAMARAFGALANEERDFEMRPWLFRIAHNEAISLLRQRRATTSLDAASEVQGSSLDRRVADREDLAVLQADLLSLSERQRSALVMRELSGLRHDEIAGALQTSTSAVKQAIFEARTALHECREGRAMDCEEIRRALSDGDGRVRRGRKLRAHARTCSGCRDFAADLQQRPARLAALAPPLPLALGGSMLAHLLPGTKAAVSVGASTAYSAGAGAVTKVAVTALIAAGTAGGVATVAQHQAPAPPHPSRPAAAHARSAGALGGGAAAGGDAKARTPARHGAKRRDTGEARTSQPSSRASRKPSAAAHRSPMTSSPPGHRAAVEGNRSRRPVTAGAIARPHPARTPAASGARRRPSPASATRPARPATPAKMPGPSTSPASAAPSTAPSAPRSPSAPSAPALPSPVDHASTGRGLPG